MTEPSDPFKPCWYCGSSEHLTHQHEPSANLGELINARVRAGAALIHAREALERAARAPVAVRAKAKLALDDALADYGEALWREERSWREERGQ